MNNWEENVDYPKWMTEESLTTLYRQHLGNNETPKMMFDRIINSLEGYSKDKLVVERWKEYLWNGWLSPATPIMANIGTGRGLPISCFIERVSDSIESIFDNAKQLALLTQGGGGVGITIDKIRGNGEPITNNGFSSGVVPFCKVYDSTVSAVSQAGGRRGAASINLPVRHKDIEVFLNIRKAKGDLNQQCHNINHCVTIDDYFMNKLVEGDEQSRDLWAKIISTRLSTGQPYIMFYHNAHNQRPNDMVKRNLKIDGTNICCLAGDTEVITKEGVSKIKDLVGKEVTIYDGQHWVKCNNFTEYSEDDLYEITLKNGQKLQANANHRWFAATNYNDIRNRNYKTFKTIELSEGYWLEDALHQNVYHGNNTMNGAYLKGFLLADGTSIKDRPLLNVHFTKYQCITKLIESCLEVGIGEVNTNANSIVQFSEEIVNPNQFGKQCFKTMKGLSVRKQDLINYATIYKQHLPDFRNLNKESKVEFLSGLLDGDGCYSTSGIQLSSIHLEFIEQLQKLIFSFGYNASIDTVYIEDRLPLYRVTIGTYDSYQLIQELNCARLEISDIEPNRRTTGYRQVVKIEKLNKKEKVYCPQVPTTKKFLLANGIMTGNTEIMLPHDDLHTVVCCLSSVNMAKYDEWKDSLDFIKDSLYFLDCIISYFIDNAKNKPGFEKSVRFAEKSRAVGLGVLGWHTYLQMNNVPFISLRTRSLIGMVGRKFERGVEEYNKFCKLYNLESPEWCDTNRNLTMFAIAPTTTTSLVQGGVSQGIEPIVANSWIQKSANNTFIRYNNQFKYLVETKYPEHNTPEFWEDMATTHQGSVQHLEWLTELEREVFLTAYEINQLELVNNVALWQKYIDQGISCNLFFPPGTDAKWVNKVHLNAWEKGIKSLYYVRTDSILNSYMGENSFKDCVFCEG